MTEPTLQQRSDRLGVKMLLVVLALTAAVFAWNQTNYQRSGDGADTWVDVSGRVNVLGITIGETTVRQAETLLKSRSDIALYIYPQHHPNAGKTLEAFFPAITDHTKVVLLLDPDPEVMLALESRATIPHLYPNEVARMNLHADDLITARKQVVKALTLIPSVSLDEADIIGRFGTPTEVVAQEDDSKILRFSELGLDAYIDPKGSARLRFSNP